MPGLAKPPHRSLGVTHSSSTPPRLGDNHPPAKRILPTHGDYPFNDPHGPFPMQLPYNPPDDPVTGVVLALENAKRRAADASARASLGDKQRDEALESEIEVVRCRLNVLGEFIHPKHAGGSQDPHLCLPVNSTTHEPCASVLYRRLHATGAALHAVQAPIAWKTSTLIHWGRLEALNPKDGNPDSEVPNNLLCQLVADAVITATRDESTAKLRELHWKHNALRTGLFFKRAERGQGLEAGHWQAPEPCRHSVEVLYRAQSKEKVDGEHVLVDVLWGTLLMNHCEPWHNPNINTYVQKAILKAGEHGEHRTEGDPRCFVRPVIRITHAKEIHVLILAPFRKPDSCTVQHIHICDDGYHAGILNNHSSPTVEYVESMQCYHCVGTRPNARFNEQELNYIHSRAWEPHKAVLVQPDMPSGKAWNAKSARISFADWDILVTTYTTKKNEGGQEEGGDGHYMAPTRGDDGKKGYRYVHNASGTRTVITLFNYPPQGMRYTKDALDANSPAFGQRRPITTSNRRRYAAPRRQEGASTIYLPGGVEQRNVDLTAEPFYVTWFSKDTEEPNHINETRIYFLEILERGWATNYARHVFKQVRTAIGARFRDHWLEDPMHNGGGRTFVQNIRENEYRVDGMTPMELYRALWADWICRAIHNVIQHQANEICMVIVDNPEKVWHDIFQCANLPNEEDTIRKWIEYTLDRVKNDPHKRLQNPDRSQLPSQQMPHAQQRLATRRVQPRPRLDRAAGTDSAGEIQALRTKIRDLEARNENRDHLLHQVLENLSRR